MGINRQVKDTIDRVVDSLFNTMAISLLGKALGIDKKRLHFSSKKPEITLLDLFVKGMRSKSPNEYEKETFRTIIEQSHGYVSSLRDRTKSNLIAEIDSKIREADAKGSRVSESEIKAAIKKELDKSKSHLKTIAEAESTKTRNMGSALDILRVGSSLGIKDPHCYFVVVKDKVTCKFCIKAHLMPDKVTPRVYKFSELKQGYLNTEERKAGKASVFGNHPHCRCSLVFLSPGFGFKNGKISWIGLDHNEYNKQKK